MSDCESSSIPSLSKVGTRLLNSWLVVRGRFLVAMNTFSLNKPQVSFKSQWAALLVVLLYPVFFFYNVGLSLNLYPQFAGGWYGPVSAVIGLPFVLYLLIKWVGPFKLNATRMDVLIYAMICYFAAWSVVFHFLGNGYSRSNAQFGYTMEMLLLWLVTYVSFKHIAYNSKLIIKVMSIAWVLMLLIAVLNIKNGMYYAALQSTAGSNVSIATYQGFSRSALVVAAFLMAYLRGYKLAICAVLSVALLFILGARTEFVGILVIIGVCIVFGKHYGPVKAAYLVGIGLMLVGVVSYYSGVADQSRIRNLLDLSQDSSWQLRVEFSYAALDTIKSHFLTGDYGSQQQFGTVGVYAHNALSAWVDYGLFGFIGFVSVNLLSFVYALKAVIRDRLRSNGLALFALAISSYCIIIMIFAQSVGAPIFAVSWGAAAALLCSPERAVTNLCGRGSRVMVGRSRQPH